jgi:hypothetical protein
VGVRVRILSISTAVAMVLGAAGLVAPAASAGRSPQLTHHGKPKAPSRSIVRVLYDQNDNDTGIGITSQNFESVYDAYDDQAADDFTVPAGHTWRIRNVTVTGTYFSGIGPARSWNVFIYTDGGGLPGALIASRTKRGKSTCCSFWFTFSNRIEVPAGVNWLSLQANMDFDPNGQWGWESRSVQSGNPAMWQNPGDGFATGCTTWGVLTTCVPVGEFADLMFSLGGQER